MRSHALRSIAAALGVGALVGLLVAGLGARLAMGLIALADDRGGTVAVLLTGIVLGMVGALAYVGLRAWLPARAGYRSLVFILMVLGFGLFTTIEGNQEDFVFLSTAVSIASFAVVL